MRNKLEQLKGQSFMSVENLEEKFLNTLEELGTFGIIDFNNDLENGVLSFTFDDLEFDDESHPAYEIDIFTEITENKNIYIKDVELHTNGN